MKRSTWTALFSAIILFLLSSAAAAAPSGSGGPVLVFNPDEVKSQVTGAQEAAGDQNNPSAIQKHIQAFLKAATLEEKQQIVSELSDFCIQRGLRPSPDVAEIFLYLAAEAKSQGRHDDYRRCATFAETFDADHPAVHLTLASAARRQHGIFSGSFIFETLNAFILSFIHPYTRPIALANLGIWARITGFLLLGIFSLLLMLKYQGLLRHDVHEWLGAQDQPWNRAAGWVVLFLPSLLFLSGFWWCAYWAGLFLLYARRSEKAVTLAASVIFVATGLLATWTAQELYLTQSPILASNLRCYQNRTDMGGDAFLISLSGSESPRKDQYAFLLASRHLIHGSYPKAEDLYKDLLSRNSTDASVANNLGCILCYEGRYQEAIQLFTKAIEAKGDLAAPYFNRGLARTKIFNFSEAKEDQDKARSKDRDFISSHNLSKQEDWGPVPLFMPLELARDLAIAQEREKEGRSGIPKRPTTSMLVLALRPPFGAAVPLLVIGFLCIALSRKRGFFAQACYKCGRPYCGRCKTSLEFESHCAQCVHLYIKQDGVSPEARMRKNYEVEQHNRFLRVMRGTLSLLAPGAGHFVEGRPFSSLFLLTLWCGFLATFLLRIYALPLPIAVSTAPFWSAFSVVGILLMLLLWLSFGLPRAMSREIPRPAPESRS